MSWAEEDMTQGYMDGMDLSSPEPSGNRSRSYRHGFLNGRADRAGKIAWGSLQQARDAAAACISADENTFS